MLIGLKYKNKKFVIKNVKKLSLFGMIKGLMFSKREKAKALLFRFPIKNRKNSIHTYFVFFSLIAIWLDDKFNILDAKIVKPWTFKVTPKKVSYHLVEIPMNKKYSKINSEIIEKVISPR